MQLQLITASSEQTYDLGAELGQRIGENSVLAFYGDLGAGKTTFIKGLASNFINCDNEIVSSPTFTYLNIYEGKKTLYHFDLYRLTQLDQFLSMGFEEYFEFGGICCIEWAERVSSILPYTTWMISIFHKEQDKREIIIESFDGKNKF